MELYGSLLRYFDGDFVEAFESIQRLALVSALNLCAFEFSLFEYNSNRCFSPSFLCSGASPSDGPVSTCGTTGSGTRTSTGDRDVAFAPVSEELPPVPVRAQALT